MSNSKGFSHTVQIEIYLLKKKVKELRAIAKKYGISPSGMRKKQLIEAIKLKMLNGEKNES